MMFQFSPEYMSKHIYDAAYYAKGSYADAYYAVLIAYGRILAITGYKEHLMTRHELVQRDDL